jgi:hypothetical protein
MELKKKMCKWNKWGDTRIDPCMRELIKYLKDKHKPILSCCGHGKYNPSVIVKEYGKINGKREVYFKEIFSGKILRVKENPLDKDPKKFYKRDKQGFYFIPELN